MKILPSEDIDRLLAAPKNCNWLTDKGTEGGHNAAANELREGLVDYDLFSILLLQPLDSCIVRSPVKVNNLYNLSSFSTHSY